METGKRLDVRLESFLRRNLSREDYDRLYASEASVVSSPEEKRVHRYAILGHDRLYTLEIPPKKLKTVLMLEDVVSIQLLYDFPNFLSGEEQQNTVHIQVEYKKLIPIKGSSKTLSTTSSTHQHVTPPPAAASPPLVVLPLPTSRKSPTPRPSTPPANLKDADLPGRSLPVMKPRSPRGKSPARARRALAKRQRLLNKSFEEGEGMLSPRSGLKDPLVFVDEGEEEGEGHHMSTDTLLFPGAAGTEGTAGHKLLLSMPDLSASPTSTMIASSSESSSDVPAPSLLERVSSGSVATSSAVEVVLDLYILKKKTDFYDQIMVAWTDSKIRHTLEQSNPVSPERRTLSTEHFFRQFGTLRAELLSASELDDSTLLCHELSTAAQKYFIVKMLFWEDTDLLPFILKLLKDRLSKCSVGAEDVESHLEHAVVLIDVLYQMLRETHSLNPRRLTPLFQDHGAMALSLCVTVIKHISLLSSAVDALLMAEIVETGCGLLYEVLQAVEQARWLLCASKFKVSSLWLVNRMIQEVKLDVFHSKMVNYISEVLAINPNMPGSQEQVTLYQLGVVVLTILKHSSSQVRYYKEHFTEEFKYYIARRHIKTRLPPDSPLARSIMDVLQACCDKVLA